jgi:hypothetical protein
MGFFSEILLVGISKMKFKNISRQGVVVHICNPSCSKDGDQSGGLWLEASRGKRIARSCLIQQAGHGGGMPVVPAVLETIGRRSMVLKYEPLLEK